MSKAKKDKDKRSKKELAEALALAQKLVDLADEAAGKAHDSAFLGD